MLPATLVPEVQWRVLSCYVHIGHPAFLPRLYQGVPQLLPDRPAPTAHTRDPAVLVTGRPVAPTCGTLYINLTEALSQNPDHLVLVPTPKPRVGPPLHWLKT